MYVGLVQQGGILILSQTVITSAHEERGEIFLLLLPPPLSKGGEPPPQDMVISAICWIVLGFFRFFLALALSSSPFFLGTSIAFVASVVLAVMDLTFTGKRRAGRGGRSNTREYKGCFEVTALKDNTC